MNYWYLKNNDAVGPFSLSDMLALAGNGTVSAETMVSRDGGEFGLAYHFDELRVAVSPAAKPAAVAPLSVGSRVAMVLVCLVAWPIALVFALVKLGGQDRREAFFLLRWVAVSAVLWWAAAAVL
jgi:hypothetical protein